MRMQLNWIAFIRPLYVQHENISNLILVKWNKFGAYCYRGAFSTYMYIPRIQKPCCFPWENLKRYPMFLLVSSTVTRYIYTMFCVINEMLI